MAATALADYIHCPHRFWLRHMVRFRPQWNRLGEDEAGEEAGASFGEAVHRALASLTYHPDQDRALVQRLRQQGGEASAELVESFLACELYAQAATAEARAAEVPFAFLLGGTLLEGRVDLLFRCKSGWSVVDFKTHSLRQGAAKRLAAHFVPQLEIYALAAARALEAQAARAQALFLRSGEALSVAPDAARLASLEQELHAALQDIAAARFPFHVSSVCEACEFGGGEHCEGVRGGGAG